MKKLERDNLIKIFNERSKIKNDDITTEEYLNLFNAIENEINSHIFEIDNRFVTYGRRNFLLQEFNNYLINSDYLGA